MNSVRPFVTATRRPPRRGCNAVEIGTTLFAVYNTKIRKYFIWCYTDEAYARTIAARIEPTGKTDIAANWRDKTDTLVHTTRTHD